ncbi:vomeronasal type-1 receptor 4-like [Neovison vison]|uniref:vomeronasal type-1 receptor 4-like n=1 Tax=Neovison vison TaxID=452646 RepID=UPI001CEFC9CC|nr:vomeronasal type-1 receptor 4-like [Neogale vison]
MVNSGLKHFFSDFRCQLLFHVHRVGRGGSLISICLFSTSLFILFLGIIIWASSSMVGVLHRHKQRVQHIHRTTISTRYSPESRVTQRTLVSFYFLYSIFQGQRRQ